MTDPGPLVHRVRDLADIRAMLDHSAEEARLARLALVDAIRESAGPGSAEAIRKAAGRLNGLERVEIATRAYYLDALHKASTAALAKAHRATRE